MAPVKPIPESHEYRQKWKTRRGKRSTESKARRLKVYLDNVQGKTVASVEARREKETLKVYPGDLVHAAKNKLHVDLLVQRQYPEGVLASQLPRFDPDDSFFLLPPEDSKEACRPLHPLFMAARFEHVITKPGQKEIVKAWDALQFVGVKHHAGSREANRSSTLALHLGVWEVQQSFPKVTRDTRLQTPEALSAIDRLLLAVGTHVAPKILALLQRYAPKQLDRQLRTNKVIKRLLRQEFLLRPALDFRGAFFCFAIKEGTSEVIHLDWNDDLDTITWLIALGEWEGGEITLVYKGVERRIPLHAGSVFGFMARTWPHCTTPVTSGRRIILTCFSDSNLLRRASRFMLHHQGVIII
ncbi:uncharacterized protein EDB91DRAFT_1256737 [Suillus paluster]|uniref:uncharacterized protein n=1 Tax=Suillus paluster TaxID=48578 RepID=UPI001B885A51|nr:uncharacterized protein EDB91DRAFT_1256737 [Suillus paluster]KAG1720981.1 hypothetical protein EDB91DRAFT_1256737 [Suillus paluster]